MAAVAGGGLRDRPGYNVLALGLDFALYLTGMAFASPATVLPAFAAHLGASNLAIGAVPAVLTLGWFLPSLFAANYTERLPRKLPFVLRYSPGERLPLLLLAGVAFGLAGPAPGAALALTFALLLVMTTTTGTLMPAWMDIVGRAVPTTRRGRFFGVAQLGGSAGGLLGSLATAWLLAAVPAPHSYGYCFLAGFACLVLSYLVLASVREPPGVARQEPLGLGAYLRRMPGLLRRDQDLAWFLVARGLGILGAMATGFYTVYALRVWQAPEWQVGAFTTTFLVGQVVGTLVAGWLADRAGHRLVLALGLAALAAGNVAAVPAGSAAALGPVFALLGFHHAAIHVSARTILLELAADVAVRPTYLGLANTALAPLSVGASLVAGLLVEALGFRPMFGLAAVLAGAGLAVLLTRVREPRAAGASR